MAHDRPISRRSSLHEIVERFHADSEAWFPGVAADIDFQVFGIVGELGELVNLLKKRKRGDIADDDLEFEIKIAHEWADTFTYLMLLGESLGVDPVEAINSKRRVLYERWGDPDDE